MAGGAAAPFACTMVEAAVCLANEMVGGADRLREDALAYAMMCMQLGKPIASFQSMKRKQADMLLDVELAKSAAYYAAASLDEGDDDAVANAHVAKAFASDAYMQTAIHADLEKQADANPTAFLALVSKVLPMQITGKDGGPIEHRIDAPAKETREEWLTRREAEDRPAVH
jgi:hypothetical protein